MGSFAQQIIKASAATLGGRNRCVPSQPRPSTLLCSQPALSPPSHQWAPSSATARRNAAQLDVALALFFLHPGNKMLFGACCWACWLRSTRVFAVSDVSLATPPSLHRGAAGSSFDYTHSSTKGHEPNVLLRLAKLCRSLERWKGFPKPRKHERLLSCSLCRTCLPGPLAVPHKTVDTTLQQKNEISEQHVPNPKHCIGILVFPPLQSSLIYPKPTSLLLNTCELYWAISDATNGHDVSADDTVPSLHARRSFQISLHRRCISAGWNDVPCSFLVHAVKREGKK